MLDLSQRPGLDITVTDRQRLVAMRKAIDAQIETATQSIKDAMMEAGVDTARVGTLRVTLTVRSRATLDKRSLIERGVSVETIEAATIAGVPYVQLDIREAA